MSKIIHTDFGPGEVVSRDGDTLTVRFDNLTVRIQAGIVLCDCTADLAETSRFDSGWQLS